MTDVKRSMRSDNPLNGKHIVFLGSSVTYGAASNGVSFVDFLAEKMGCRVTKEAVSGTTLVDDAPDSYICRMKKLNPEMKVDLFVCQLSTNDATQMKDLGETCRTYDMDDFNTLTVAGAIEYIIAYARKTWKCPVAFYTSPSTSSRMPGKHGSVRWRSIQAPDTTVRGTPPWSDYCRRSGASGTLC